jgi:hypothetical protein
MINFRQKSFSEHTAMNFFYAKLMSYGGDNKKWPIIDKSALLPILRGNNIVIEKFTIVDSWIGDRYRMYIKVGAKATLPEDVRMPRGKGYDQNLGRIKLGLKGFSDNNNNNNNNNNNPLNNNNKNKEGRLGFSLENEPCVSLSYRVNGEELGKTIEYNKATRSLVLEFKRIDSAIECLNYLPFGFGYRIYLLDSK